MRIGVLTGGGDCPGLNAVIRAVVRKGVEIYGHEFVGFRDGWRGPLEGLTKPLGVAEVRGILPRGGTILGSSRTNPFKIDGGVEKIKANLAELGIDALVAIGGEDTLGVATKLHELGVQRRRRTEDDRQRPRRDRLHVRLRHRGQHRDGGDRPAAHHGRVAPPHARRRGHGPARRLDRAARRPRRWRERDPAAGAQFDVDQVAAYVEKRFQHAVRADRRGRRGRAAARRPDGRCTTRSSTRSATSASAASASGWPSSSRRRPARKPARSCSATSSAAARRPRSTGCSRPGSACTRSTRCTTATSARWSRCAAPTSSGCRWSRRTRELKTVPESRVTPRPRSSSAESGPDHRVDHEVDSACRVLTS